MQTQSDDLTGKYMNERNDSVVSPYDELMGEKRQEVQPLKKVFRFFADVGQGALIESPKQITGGVYDAAMNAGKAVESLLDWFGTPQVLQITNENGEFDLDLLTRGEFEEKGGKRIAEVMRPGEARTTTGGMIRGTAQFLTGFLPATKALKGIGGTGKLATMGRAMGAGAITDAFAFDPHEERLSNLLVKFPVLNNPVTRYLQAEPDDSEAEGRFKNTIEGMGLGILTDGFIAAVKGIRGSVIRKAAERKAAREAAQEAEVIEKFANIEDTPKPLTPEEQKLIEAETTGLKETTEEVKGKYETPPGETKKQLFKMGDVKAGDERALNINLEYIDTTDDVKKLINDVGEAFPDPINEARREVVTNERTKKLADDLGMTVDDLLTRRKGVAFNAEEALAARNILVSSGENLVNLAKEAVSGGDEAVLNFRRAMVQHYAIQKQVSGMTAEAGRALQSFQIAAKGGKERQQMIKDVLEMAGGIGDSKLLAEMVSDIDNPRALNKFVDEAAKAKTKDMLYEAWINGLLSNPSTHAVNAIGNSITTFMGIGERKLASMIGAGLGGQAIKQGEVQALTWGMKEGTKDGFRLAWETLKTGIPSSVTSKQEFLKYHSITSENLNLTGPAGYAADFLGSSVRIPGRLLMASDELFKSIGYRMELHAQAFREATSKGLQGDEFAKKISDILENPPENIKLEAMSFADYQTFTKPLGETGQTFQKLVNRTPGLKVIVPFVRTPVNIMKYVGERSPLAIIAPGIRADILAGGARRDMAMAKISMGSMIMALSADMAMNGQITGSGPPDMEVRKNLMATGWQPYSIKVGDQYYSYNRLDPVGASLGIAADITQIIGQTDDIDTLDMVTASVASVARNVTSKTYLRGISDFFAAYGSISDDPENKNTRIKNWIIRQGSSVVPSGVAGLERMIDPTLREANTLLEKIQSKVPGWSASLPPVRNIFGEAVVLQGGIGPDIMSPIYQSTYKNDPIADEIAKQETGIRMPFKSIDGVELSTQEYDQYILFYSGQNNRFVNNKPIKSELRELFASDLYQKGTDGPDGTKSSMIKSVFQTYKKAAKQMMKEKNHEIANKLREKQMEKRINLGVK